MTDKHNTTETRNMIMKGANNRHQSMRPRTDNGRGNNMPTEFCKCGKVARLTWKNGVRYCRECFIKLLQGDLS